LSTVKEEEKEEEEEEEKESVGRYRISCRSF
jgi:hypothetical protein